MRIIYPIIAIMFVWSFSACKSKNSTDATTSNPKEIKMLEDSLLSNPIGENYNAKAPVLASEMLKYAETHPKDTLAAVYLFKAGDLYRGLGRFRESLQSWQTICDKYPDYKRAPDALFLQAFTIENELKDYEKAKSLYNEFLKKYPTHSFAATIPSILKNMGKSPDELIKSFKAQDSTQH